jgi:OFA family oxalate/formate antiporter-like MFS transporter
MFGTKNLTENYGLMYIVFGFASILGPRIAVSSVEQSGGSYEYAYIIAIALSCVGLILSILLRRIDIKRKKIINKGVQV